MEPGHIIVRAAIGYVFLLLLSRLAGRQVISEARPQDFVMAAILGDMFDDFLWGEIGAPRFAVATSTLVLTHLLVGLVSARANGRLQALIEGRPRMMLDDGRPKDESLRKERLTEKDLAALLRKRGLSRGRWNEVSGAHLETNGRLSAILHGWARPAINRDARAVRRLRKE